MEQAISNMIDWEMAFPAEEYAERRMKVQAALAAAGFDGMLVTSPRDYHYLTGYDHIWQYKYHITGLFFETATASFVFFDQETHRVIAATTPEVTDIFFNRRGKATAQAQETAEYLIGRGLIKGRIAIQTWDYGAHPDLIRAMGAKFRDAGAEVIETSELLEDVRLYKSPREVAIMRKAGEISSKAMAAARDFIAPGVAETEIDAVICYELMKNGCGHPGIRNMIQSGARSGAHHGPATHRKLKAGDVIHIDFCASLHRYHVNMSRSFAVGEIDSRWHDLMDRSAGCTEAILAGVKPGDPFSQVQRAADDFIAQSGVNRTKYEWFIGGYALGIAFPPDWVHRHRPLAREDVPDPEMKPGIVFNFEVQYDVMEGWPGGSGAGWIDSYLMTDTGLEVLTDAPRTLVIVGV